MTQSEENHRPRDSASETETVPPNLEDFAVITVDSKGAVSQWSSGAEKIFGYAPSEIVGRPLTLLFTPEDRAAGRPAEELGIAARQDTIEDERWHLRKDGVRIFVSGTVRATRSETGELTGFTKIVREITAQKLQEFQRDAQLVKEKIARAEAERRWKLLEELFDNAPLAITALRLPEKKYVFANRMARELARDRPVVGLALREAFTEVESDIFDAIETVAVTGRPYSATERVVGLPDTGGFQERYFSFLCQPIYSEVGQYEAILIFAIDVSDRVRARAAIDEQRDLLDLAHDPIMSLAMDGSIEFWNRGAEMMYGWTREEALGRNVHELLRTTAERPIEEIRAAVFSKGEWNGELKHRNRRGQELEVWSRWVVRTRHGRPSGWLEIVRDMTERKRLEANLRDAQKLESLGLLAGGVAHDFNNILTGVIGNVSLALEVSEPASSIHRLLSDALAASERAALLIKQMLAYAGKGQFVVQPLDLSKIVRDTLPLAERSIGKGVHVELALSEQLPPVEADATQIEQVAMNFILNAAEAIGDRPGRISIRTGVRDIRPGEPAGSYDVGQPEPGRYAMLEVQDTGPGIDEAIRASIFDPFFTTKFTGRGLGLAAVSGIVRSLNGAIQVESRPGQGSTFRVLFPVKAPPAPELHRARDPILVVDDDEIVRQTAQVMLRHRGYEVLLAENGQKAVDLFRERQGRVSLVLLDMTMPVMSGEEAFRLMKSIRPDVPVIVSSGYTEEEAIRRFGGLGVAGFMQKPYTVGALMEKIGRFALPR